MSEVEVEVVVLSGETVATVRCSDWAVDEGEGEVVMVLLLGEVEGGGEVERMRIVYDK